MSGDIFMSDQNCLCVHNCSLDGIDVSSFSGMCRRHGSSSGQVNIAIMI